MFNYTLSYEPPVRNYTNCSFWPTLILTWHSILKNSHFWQKMLKKHVLYTCFILFKIAFLFVCLIRVVRQVMLLSRCVPLTGRSWRPSAATSAAWRSVTWRCLRAPLRRWTSCWWEERLTGAASRRRHVSYDVSAAGLWDCFSQLCVRVGGASRLPVFFSFLSFIHLFMHSFGGCPGHISCPDRNGHQEQ